MVVYINSSEKGYENVSYQVTLETSNLDPKDKGYVKITTFMPDALAINLESMYENLVKNYLASGVEFAKATAVGTVGVVSQGLGKATEFAAEQAVSLQNINANKTLIDQFSAYPSWIGNSPLDFSIPFVFNAISDTTADVYEPIITLMKLSCPSMAEGNQIVAPGPRFKLYNGTPSLDQSRILSLKLGNYCYIRGILVKNVNTTIDSKFDKEGKPISAQALVNFSTVLPPTVQDIENWFSCNRDYSQLNRFTVSALKTSIEKKISDTTTTVSEVTADASKKIGNSAWNGLKSWIGF